MAVPLNTSQLQFDQLLSHETGLDPYVIAAWLIAEEPASRSPQAQGYNWLNIGPGRSYSSVQQAAAATGQLIASGYPQIVAAAKANNPVAELTAIAASPWDATHYGETAGDPTGHLGADFQTIVKADPSGALKDLAGKPGTSSNFFAGVPGAGAISGAVSGAASIGSVLGSFMSNPSYPFLWLGLVIAGLAMIWLGVRRLAGGSGLPHLPAAVPVPV